MTNRTYKLKSHDVKKIMNELENPEHLNASLESIDPKLKEIVSSFGKDKKEILYVTALTYEVLKKEILEKNGKLPFPIEPRTLNEVTQEILTDSLDLKIGERENSVLVKSINDYSRIQRCDALPLLYSAAIVIRAFEKQKEKYSSAD